MVQAEAPAGTTTAHELAGLVQSSNVRYYVLAPSALAPIIVFGFWVLPPQGTVHAGS